MRPSSSSPPFIRTILKPRSSISSIRIVFGQVLGPLAHNDLGSSNEDDFSFGRRNASHRDHIGEVDPDCLSSPIAALGPCRHGPLLRTCRLEQTENDWSSHILLVAPLSRSRGRLLVNGGMATGIAQVNVSTTISGLERIT